MGPLTIDIRAQEPGDEATFNIHSFVSVLIATELYHTTADPSPYSYLMLQQPNCTRAPQILCFDICVSNY